MGYDSSNPIYNCIDALFLLLLIILFMILHQFLKICKNHSIIEKAFLRVERFLYWNTFIRLFIEEYQVIAIASLIKLYAIDFTNVFESIISIIGILLIASTITVPFYTWHYLFKQSSMVGQNYKVSSLNSDLQHDDKNAQLFNVIFMIRRVVIAVNIVVFTRYSYF